MSLHDHIQPITSDVILDAQAFGVRAMRLSAMASKGVPVVPTIALSCELIAAAASGGAYSIADIVDALDAHFEEGALLALRGSPQDIHWGGPARVELIGASPDNLPPMRKGEGCADPLAQYVAEFGAVVHQLDAGAFVSKENDTPQWTQAMVAYEAHSGSAFPEARRDQLAALINSFAKSWSSASARILRSAQGAPEDAGLGLIVQLQSVGGKPDIFQSVDEMTGVARSGPDVPKYVAKMVAAARSVLGDAAAVEYQSGDTPQVIDVVVAKRNRQAEIQIVVDLVEQGVLSRDDALLRIDPRSLSEHIHPQIAPGGARDVLGYGIAASPGAAQGPLVFTADAAQAADAKGQRAILVRAETSPEDIRGMNSAAGVLTIMGGLTSHAAVIAQGLGVPCVVGASRMQIDADCDALITADGRRLVTGDVVTLDGSSGTIMEGALPLKQTTLSPAFQTLMTWSDEVRSIGVRANADTLLETRTARRFNADGIGLCRTEHMFFDLDRLTVMRELIVADDPETRASALARLLPMQRDDFEALFDLMEGAPVTIRLLDPPLHEFLPKERDGVIELARATGLTESVVKTRIQALEEYNPMLGKRGVRLAVTFPEIYDMQARAIFEAANLVNARKSTPVVPEIMIPLVSAHREVELVRARVKDVAKAVAVETGRTPEYKLGVMVETPRAALRSGDLAEASHFLSFGTNDLTQMTYGLSRDDAGRFMREYVNAGVYPEDPFLTLDLEGVGELLLIAAQRGRATNEGIELGLCGEHGGDPASVRFCRLAGFDYVSCSPYRVPIARLAAAQAELLFEKRDQAEALIHG